MQKGFGMLQQNLKKMQKNKAAPWTACISMVVRITYQPR